MVSESGTGGADEPLIGAQQRGDVGRRVVLPAAVDRGQLEQFDRRRGDNAEPALAAAQRPEQVRVPLGGHGPQLAVGQHDVERADMVGAEPEGPADRTHPATQQISADADRRRGAAQRRQPGRRGDVEHRVPGGAGTDNRGPVCDVEPNVGQPAGGQQDPVRHPGDVAMPAADDGDRKSGRRRDPHRGNHVGHSRGADGDRRAMVLGQVEPGDLGPVPVLVRRQHRAADGRPQRRQHLAAPMGRNRRTSRVVKDFTFRHGLRA